MGHSQSHDNQLEGCEGYHVLKVQKDSPGDKCGLESFFDFILAIDNIRLNLDNDTFKEMLKKNEGKEIKMTVYNSKSQNVRIVNATPAAFNGQGLLGISIRFCSFHNANENVWHVLEVHPSSPAEKAGLKPFTDYVIGADSVLHESEDLFSLIENHEGRPLKLYVYNIEEDSCREVVVEPDSKWGGEGSLGCGIGYGYLHRIPIQEIDNDNSNNKVRMNVVAQTMVAPSAMVSPQPAPVTPAFNLAPTVQENSGLSPVVAPFNPAPESTKTSVENSTPQDQHMSPLISSYFEHSKAELDIVGNEAAKRAEV